MIVKRCSAEEILDRRPGSVRPASVRPASVRPASVRAASRSLTRLSGAILFAVSSAAVLGCGSSRQGALPPSAVDGMPLHIDALSARGFLGGSEYERYHLKQSLLWRECGDIKKKPPRTAAKTLEGDEVLTKDPSLELRERRVEQLDASQLRALKEAALKLVNAKETDDPEPLPGSFFSLSDPGLFELTIRLGGKKRHIVTSVDAVAEKQSLPLAETHEFFAILRGIGPAICNAKTFFGIERAEL